MTTEEFNEARAGELWARCRELQAEVLELRELNAKLLEAIAKAEER